MSESTMLAIRTIAAPDESFWEGNIMTALSRAWSAQLFTPWPEHPNWLSVVLWWEVRRVPYNIIVGFAGVISMVASFFLIIASGTLEPGEDAVEPMAWFGLPLLGAIFFNICYSAGWIMEFFVKATFQNYPRALGMVLFVAGLLLSLAIVLSPAIMWGAYDIALWAGLVTE